MDPAAKLPLEVFSLILQNLGCMKRIVVVQRVSKSWEQILMSVCTPSWIILQLGIDTDWCRMESDSGKDEKGDLEDEGWKRVKDEARRCNSVLNALPSSARRTDMDMSDLDWEVSFCEQTSTYVRSDYIVTSYAETKSDMDYRERYLHPNIDYQIRRQTEGDSKSQKPIHQWYDLVNNVEREEILTRVALDEGEESDFEFEDVFETELYLDEWSYRLFGTAQDCVLTYVGMSPARHGNPGIEERLICISTKTCEILWTCCPISAIASASINLTDEGGSTAPPQNYQLPRWSMENVPHTTTNLFTYLLRPIGSTLPYLSGDTSDPITIGYPYHTFLTSGHHPITLVTLDLTTGKTLHHLTHTIPNVSYTHHSALGETCALAHLAHPSNPHLRLFTYFHTLTESWTLLLLDLSLSSPTLASTPLCTYPLSTFTELNPSTPTTTSITITPSTIFTTNTHHHTPYTHHLTTATAISLNPPSLRPIESSLYETPQNLHNLRFAREPHHPVLNPRSRLAAAFPPIYLTGLLTPHRAYGSVSPTLAVITFVENTAHRHRTADGILCRVWNAGQAKPVRVLEEKKPVVEKSGVEKVRQRSGAREKIADGSGEVDGEGGREVLSFGEGFIVLTDGVLWFE